MPAQPRPCPTVMVAPPPPQGPVSRAAVIVENVEKAVWGTQAKQAQLCCSGCVVRCTKEVRHCSVRCKKEAAVSVGRAYKAGTGQLEHKAALGKSASCPRNDSIPVHTLLALLEFADLSALTP
eukprot:scaffold80957_cov17-Tisochrysis_lutea.AAC.1